VLILLQWWLAHGALIVAEDGGNITSGSSSELWLWLLGIVSVVSAFFTVKPLFTGFGKAKSAVLGLKVEEHEQQELWAFVRRLAAEAGAKVPDNIIVGLTPNFFVTEATVTCASGTFNGSTMYLSLPLCRIFSTEELAAVILHELAHFKGDDAKFTLDFYPIYRGISESVSGVSNASSVVIKLSSHLRWWPIVLSGMLLGLLMLPPACLMHLFFDVFSWVENKIGRDREFVADALGAFYQGPKSMASALVKLHAYDNVWKEVALEMRNANATGTVEAAGKVHKAREWYFNSSMMFALRVEAFANVKMFHNLDAVKTPHPTDTHPPLSMRLKALGATIEAVSDTALLVGFSQEGPALFDGLETLEMQLTHMQWELGMFNG
jgi:Zn-dependent protease with chaperone function